jgi:hemerythrin-like metal-binding protein
MTTFNIPWLQKLALAEDNFDEDHWNLLDKVNALLLATSSANETRVLMASSGLRVAAQEHFAREEVQMRALRYPALEQHCESHRRLLDGLSSLQFMLRNMDGFTRRNTEGFMSTTGLFAFLQRWFEAHLTNDDKKFTDFLAQRAPLVAAEAA